MKSVFRPRARIEGLKDTAQRELYRIFLDIKTDLDNALISPRFSELKRSNHQAAAGEFVRVSPLGEQTVALERPRRENQGAEIRVMVEDVLSGTLRIQAIQGTVDKLPIVEVTAVGLMVCTSNGVDNWSLSFIAGTASETVIPETPTETYQGNISGADATPSSIGLATLAGTNLTYDAGTHTLNAAGGADNITASTGVVRVVDDIQLATAAANTIKANPTAGPAAPGDSPVSAHSFLARFGANITQKAFSSFFGARLTYDSGTGTVSADVQGETLTASNGVQRIADDISFITQAGNTFLLNALSTVARAVPVALADHSFLGRFGANIAGKTFASFFGDRLTYDSGTGTVSADVQAGETITASGGIIRIADDVSLDELGATERVLGSAFEAADSLPTAIGGNAIGRFMRRTDAIDIAVEPNGGPLSDGTYTSVEIVIPTNITSVRLVGVIAGDITIVGFSSGKRDGHEVTFSTTSFNQRVLFSGEDALELTAENGILFDRSFGTTGVSGDWILNNPRQTITFRNDFTRSGRRWRPTCHVDPAFVNWTTSSELDVIIRSATQFVHRRLVPSDIDGLATITASNGVQRILDDISLAVVAAHTFLANATASAVRPVAKTLASLAGDNLTYNESTGAIDAATGLTFQVNGADNGPASTLNVTDSTTVSPSLLVIAGTAILSMNVRVASILDSLLADMPGRSVKLRAVSSTGAPGNLTLADHSFVATATGNIFAKTLASLAGTNITYNTGTGALDATGGGGGGLTSSNQGLEDDGTTVGIANGGVTNAKYADNSITQVKMGGSSVGEPQLLSNSVTQAKMADNSVGEAELISSSVTTTKIANNSVVTAKILDNAITTQKIATNGVQLLNMANDSVGVNELINGNVTLAKMANLAANSMIGRDGSSGTPQQIAVNSHSFSGRKGASFGSQTLSGLAGNGLSYDTGSGAFNAAGQLVRVSVATDFAASGNYVVQSQTRLVVVKLHGGSGGGGGSNDENAGGGGGDGATVLFFSTVTGSQSLAYVRGAQGSGGSGTTGGSQGGNTTLLGRTAGGGFGGGSGNAGGAGGNGGFPAGSSTNRIMQAQGVAGGRGFYVNTGTFSAQGGVGGGSGTGPQIGNSDGGDAVHQGGGNGACSFATVTQTGGLGFLGHLVIEEYT